MPDKKDHQEIREAIAKLPEGAKEQQAWEDIGKDKDGQEKVPRHVFRDLWLEIRVPVKPIENGKPKTQPKPEVDTKK